MKKHIFVFILSLFLVSTVSAQSVQKSVCIDPGHGGSDVGAVNGSIKESELNLDIAKRLFILLKNSGYNVFQTRTTDEALSNNDRYTFCNNNKATILLSIHHNSTTKATVDYSRALYMKKSDVDLAKAVVGSISSQLGLANSGISRFASGVLLKANMPATISEGFFLSNSNEYTLLTTGDSRKQSEAEALKMAVINYFSSH